MSSATAETQTRPADRPCVCACVFVCVSVRVCVYVCVFVCVVCVSVVLTHTEHGAGPALGPEPTKDISQVTHTAALQ